MSKAKYTKGPWEVGKENTETGRIGIVFPLIGDCDPGDIGCLAGVLCNDGSEAGEKGWANATLIAAAPELFELGREAMLGICSDCKGISYPRCPNVDHACYMFQQLIDRLESEVCE